MSKVIGVIWRDPQGNLKPEKYDATVFSVKTDPGWLKIISKDGPFRLIPSDKVHMVEFIEEEEKPSILSPHEVLQPPAKFKVPQ